MWEDPIVHEVRSEREKLAAQFNFDVDAIFEDLRKRQITLGERLVRPRRQKGPNPRLHPTGIPRGFILAGEPETLFRTLRARNNGLRITIRLLLGAFNVENMFERARAMNFDTSI